MIIRNIRLEFQGCTGAGRIAKLATSFGALEQSAKGTFDSFRLTRRLTVLYC